MKILYIKSELKEGSKPSVIAEYFLEKVAQKNKNIEIITLDLSVQKIGSIALNSNNFSSFWTEVEADKWINLLKTVDKVVISTPIINWHYSAEIKNFFDAICLADKTFSYKYSKKGGSIGLLTNIKNVQIITTYHAPEAQRPLINAENAIAGTFEFIGAQKINDPIILFQGYLLDKNEDVIEKLSSKIEAAVETF
ncbi:FMN-dependent NADH-azoreductase [Mesomycoplasma conjunctivae]|uniref:Acyl carrier protein phosphodiesterase n=1 Tax=Mesomycoplasma conjunctivae (strain ATCC 25834 / NCTC 10147 / HRC/581) TaxID=572263 RepID=C5J6Q6_MESCH|nr:FMN-dependent NADH-azoreductase [Mesomycoplasma conjunctivae]CAT05166.1 Acyl carrier protein phosphodiesterase [Mesomycoplasma conjunctivae]VEU66174.1 FMN-dependent NADH-azoreductase [Mesomycoplasma conjunctivae]